MRIAILVTLIAVLIVLVYIAVTLKKNAANQVKPEDMKGFFSSMVNQVPGQVQAGINNIFAPANPNVGVGKFVS